MADATADMQAATGTDLTPRSRTSSTGLMKGLKKRISKVFDRDSPKSSRATSMALPEEESPTTERIPAHNTSADEAGAKGKDSVLPEVKKVVAEATSSAVRRADSASSHSTVNKAPPTAPFASQSESQTAHKATVNKAGSEPLVGPTPSQLLDASDTAPPKQVRRAGSAEVGAGSSAGVPIKAKRGGEAWETPSANPLAGTPVQEAYKKHHDKEPKEGHKGFFWGPAARFALVLVLGMAGVYVVQETPVGHDLKKRVHSAKARVRGHHKKSTNGVLRHGGTLE